VENAKFNTEGGRFGASERALSSKQRPLVPDAANDGCEPIVLKNSAFPEIWQ
jgi:hypothetical protein